MNVFFTVDVEVWCDHWETIDDEFPDAFRRYIYGPGESRDSALPFQLKVLNDYGLRGVFFTEAMFALRFGRAPLEEVVGLISDAGQEVQLHLHTEWVDEAIEPPLENVRQKRQFLRDFTLAEQGILVKTGLRLLADAGAQGVNAFRAGSFGFNRDTLTALAENNVKFDSSYNPTLFGHDSDVSADGKVLYQPVYVNDVAEYPMTVFQDRPGHFRHAQLGACSFKELSSMLFQAAEAEWNSFVILSHNFETLNASRSRSDPIVVRRFQELCQLLSRHQDIFQTQGFRDLQPTVVARQPRPLKSNVVRTAQRMIEQARRKSYA